MAERNIFTVDYKILNAQGNYQNMSQFPKLFDSDDYDHDPDKAIRRAWSAYHKAVSDSYAVDDRPLQVVIITQMNGQQLDHKEIKPLPVEPSPEPEPEGETGQTGETGETGE